MDLFIKITSAVLLSVIICLILAKNGADAVVLVTAAVCSMVILSAVSFLEPIVDFCNKLQEIGKLDNRVLSILLKAVGIGLISQICCLICTDAGNQTLGKYLQCVSTAVILWLALPLLEELVTLIDAVLGAV